MKYKAQAVIAGSLNQMKVEELETLGEWLDGDPEAVTWILKVIATRIKKLNPAAYRAIYGS